MTQGTLFDSSHINATQFDPSALARRGAESYGAGTWSGADLENVQASPQRGHAQFLAYRDQLASGSETPGLRDSYAAMRDHVNSQYAHMTGPTESGGMGMTHTVTPTDPYRSAGEMSADVNAGQIKTFASASTGKHEFFSEQENDRFRAVHDVFGHAALGRGFSRNGEEAAYRSHRQMFPPEAHAALASETRGQNSYLNYGPGGFPSQEGRLVGLPQWAESDEMPVAAQPRKRIQGKRRLF